MAPETRADNEVWVQFRKFVPSQLTVSKGTRVTWTNKDNEVHTVDSGTEMSPTGLFNLTLDEDGGEKDFQSFTFSNSGIFEYYCGIHGEAGKIIVQ